MGVVVVLGLELSGWKGGKLKEKKEKTESKGLVVLVGSWFGKWWWYWWWWQGNCVQWSEGVEGR